MGLRKSLRGGLSSIFGPKKHVDDGRLSQRQELNANDATMELETTRRKGMVNQAQGQTTDANPVTNAMFNQVGNMAIYGGQFIQNIGTKSDKPGFKLLRKRVASSAFHNSAQRIDPARCHPDTRVDVMQTIYDWIVSPGPRDEWLLWLNGAAGAGKSAIMQSVAERGVCAAIAIASFFFVRADSSRNTMSPLVPTLVYQLIQEVPDTSDDILLTIGRNPLIFEQSLETQLRELLIQPLLRLPPRSRRLFVVFIDGLDECINRAQQSNLIKVLGNISIGRNIPVVFAIASRREPQIEAEFSQDQVADILTTIPLDDIQASDDIRRFLNAKFKEIKATHLRRKLLSPGWPSSTIIEKMVEKSSGQFIYASVVIGYISLPYAHPALQLDIINGIRPRNSSDNPFAYLDALYQYIFSQVKELDAVRNILAFHLIHSNYKIRGLEVLFQLAVGELEVLFADLIAVVQCSGPSHKTNMKILHASLPDFLLDKSRSGDYYIDLEEYRAHLLCMFLEWSSSISDPLSSTRSDPQYEEMQRISAILIMLGNRPVEISSRLHRACMKFSCVIYSVEMIEMCSVVIPLILDHLRKLNFKDHGQAYRHVLDVFAAGFAKHWSSHDKNHVSDDDKNEIGRESPDLLARINQIRQEETPL